MRALLLVFAVILGACALPRDPAALARADDATCRRHAKEGPGGPSANVGNALHSPPASRRRANIVAASVLTAGDRVSGHDIADVRQNVYRDCMRLRGHLEAPEPGHVPERVGVLPRASQRQF